MSDVTRILQSIDAGDPKAAEELLPIVYEELRKLAAVRLNQVPAGQTLQPTALVHEAWLRLTGGCNPQEWNSQGHFFAAAAEAMRRILIERARRRNALRHGGGQERVDIADIEVPDGIDDETLLRVNDALERLAAENPIQTEVVKLRFFVGLKNEETAKLLAVSEKSVQRYWTHAKAWLYHQIQA